MNCDSHAAKTDPASKIRFKDENFVPGIMKYSFNI